MSDEDVDPALIVAFLQSKKKSDTLSKQIDVLANKVRDVGEKLNGPVTHHVGENAVYPFGKLDHECKQSEWPTADALIKLLKDWHAARIAVQAAYMAIPEDQRGAINDPAYA